NVTYDHSLQRIRHPVRSALDKLESARLVVGSVTTSESLVLYVFSFFSFFGGVLSSWSCSPENGVSMRALSYLHASKSNERAISCLLVNIAQVICM
ncbi:hypothetical protein F4802DRAFT_580895, partial [Xylaria palmicola]